LRDAISVAAFAAYAALTIISRYIVFFPDRIYKKHKMKNPENPVNPVKKPILIRRHYVRR